MEGFKMATDVPNGSDLAKKYADDIAGKVILTTGVSPGGLGAQFVEAVAAASPGMLIIAGRKPEKTQATADKLNQLYPDVPVRTLQLDLESLNAVRTAAATVNGWDDVKNIDVVVNNAAIMAVPYELTADGYEKQFATNHLGHFLFTNLIMGKILTSKAPRVVSVSSHGHTMHPIRWADVHFDGGKTYNKWFSYGQSKTANILFARALANKLGKRGLLAFSVHPGAIFTNLGNHLFEGDDSEQKMGWAIEYRDAQRVMGNADGFTESFGGDGFVTHDQGVATHVLAAFDKDIARANGSYTLKARLADPLVDEVRAWATHDVEAEKLWRLSEQLVGEKFEL